MMKVRTFTETASKNSSGTVTVRMAFDPEEAWGHRDHYHLTGTLEGNRFRTQPIQRAEFWVLSFGPKSGCSARLVDGQRVHVEIWPESPQTDELPPDIAAALAARPKAQANFASLATFYRKGWLRWIDATKRRPEVRTARIAEMVELVEAGHKQRP